MATTASPKNPYAALVGGSTVFAGVDQGIDFTGAGPVYALGPGEVTRVEKSGSGWPGQGAVLDYLLTGGPAKGKSVYIAEDFNPASNLAVGSVIQQGEVLGQATGSGQAPGIEVGWANTSGGPLAALLPRGTNYAAAGEPQGQSFLSFTEFASAGGTGPNPFGSSGLGGVGDVLTKLGETALSVGSLGSANVAGMPGGYLSQGNLGAAASMLNAGATHIPGVQQAENAANQAAQLFSGTGSFFSWIGNTKNLVRIGEVVGGGILMLAGILIVAKGATSSQPAQQAAGAAQAAAAPVRRVRRRRSASAPRQTVSQRPPGYRAPKPKRVRSLVDQREYDRKQAERRRLSKAAPGDTIPF